MGKQWCGRVVWVLAGACGIASGPLFAQEVAPPAAGGVVPAVVVAGSTAPTAPVVTAPEIAPSVSEATREVAEASRMNTKLKLDVENAKLLRALEDAGGYPSGGGAAAGSGGRPAASTVAKARATIGAPELVGIRGSPRRLRAEFLVGGALVRVGPGEFVSDEYRVVEIGIGGVMLENAKNSVRERLFFGRPQPDGLADRPFSAAPAVLSAEREPGRTGVPLDDRMPPRN